MKKSSIVKYVMLAMLMFYFAVLVAVITRMLLVQDSKWVAFSDEQASLVTSMIEGAVGAVAAGFVLYQLKVEEKMEARENDIQEAQFILQYNQSFIQDQSMCAVEQQLEQWMNKRTTDQDVINDDNRQSVINYLVYLEGLAPLVFRGVLTLEHIDDLMAYRFFLAVNNPVVQKDQLFEYPDYYRGCFKLHKMWKEYRMRRGYSILLNESGLDKWKSYSKFVNETKIVIRPLLDGDSSMKAAELIYKTDAYIYPAMFGSLKKAKLIIPKWLKEGNGIFKNENTIIAEQNNQIVGVLLFANGIQRGRLAPQNNAVDNLPISFDDVCTKYFNSISIEDQQGIYIVCICVDERSTGKGIGTQMLDYCISRFPQKNLYLDVLSNNINAIRIYEKAGFKIVSESPGYAYKETPQKCIHMMRSGKSEQ